MENPYEYYDNKLGVKIKFLIFDRLPHPETLGLISYKALNKRITSKTCTESELRKGSWSYDALVLHSSLCQDWKDSLTLKFGKPKEVVKASFFASHYQADRKAFDFYAAYTYGDDNKKLDLKLIETYTYNASVMNAVIACKTNRKAYIKALGGVQVDIWQSLTNDVNCFREVAHNLPTTSRGLRIRYNEFLKYGYVSFVSGRLQNSNASVLKGEEQTALLDALIALPNNFDNAQVARYYNEVAIKANWKPITPQTVGNRKEKMQLTVTAGRKGVKSLENTLLMQNKRSAPKNSMLLWTLDGWKTELLYQQTYIDKNGYSSTTYHNRLTTVMVLDPTNKYIIGYAVGKDESPALIKAALRNAFQHTQELFGDMYRPYQIQSDNYQISNLTPVYEACSVHFTPAKVGNAKAKVIEPYFNRFNKKHCQKEPNWSGYNVSTGSKNQPNVDAINKNKRFFPDEMGLRKQIDTIIAADRAEKREQYIENWNGTKNEFKSALNFEMYLRYLGETTGFTNRLEGSGLLATLSGQKLTYDSFDINFRKLAHLDWALKFDPQDLSKVLVTNANSRNGKLVEVVGTYEFLLEQKHIQPMALAERTEGDALKLMEVKNHNLDILNYITDEVCKRDLLNESLFNNRPELLNDTLAKHLLTDSRGQHKDHKSENRLQAKTQHLIEVQATTDKKELNANWNQDQDNYNKSKIDYSNYL